MSDIVRKINQDIRIYDAHNDVVDELNKAVKKFPPMASAHEGWAVIKEEIDELWEEVRRKNDGSDPVREANMRKEAMQVAAMATRFMVDCT